MVVVEVVEVIMILVAKTIYGNSYIMTMTFISKLHIIYYGSYF